MNGIQATKFPALRRLGLVFFVAAALLLALGWAASDRSNALARAEAQAGGPQRQRDERPNAPTISFIDSQTPACIQLDYQRDYCQVQFNYLYVTAATNQYIISMSLRIDNRIRGYYSGFFQNYMYIPADMNGAGFNVRCGQLGSGGNPALGKAYSYNIRARETGGLSAANYGTVYCPAGPSMIHLPLVRKN